MANAASHGDVTMHWNPLVLRAVTSDRHLNVLSIGDVDIAQKIKNRQKSIIG